MPLNFPNVEKPHILQGNNLTQAFDRSRAENMQGELKRAVNVMQGGKDVDMRSTLSKAVGGEFSPMGKPQAEAFLRMNAPKIYQSFKTQENAAIKEDQSAYKMIGETAFKMATELKNMPHEERLSLAESTTKHLLSQLPPGFIKRNPDAAAELQNFDGNGDGILSDEEINRVYNELLPVFGESYKAQSPEGKAVEDFRNGVLTEDQLDKKLNPAQGTSEFERLLALSDFSEEKKTEIRNTRLESMISGKKSGFAMAIGPDGEITIMENASPEDITKSQASKALVKFKERRVSARKYISLSNRVVDSVAKSSAQLGFVGAVARAADEVKSIVKNIDSEFDVDTSEVSRNIDKYDFGSLAPESAAFKTNALTLALLFASASGLGEGRALTDTDVQRAITAVGAGTNSPEQFIARTKAIQTNLNEGLKMEAEEFGYEYKSIVEKDNKTLVKEAREAGWELRTDIKTKVSAYIGPNGEIQIVE